MSSQRTVVYRRALHDQDGSTRNSRARERQWAKQDAHPSKSIFGNVIAGIIIVIVCAFWFFGGQPSTTQTGASVPSQLGCQEADLRKCWNHH
jgi:hypothetical protein